MTIPTANLIVQTNVYGWYDVYDETWTIYTTQVDNKNYTNSIGTCRFTYTYSNNAFRISAPLTLNIPNEVATLYFVYRSNNYTYYGSMSVSDIKDAEKAQKTLNNITIVRN